MIRRHLTTKLLCSMLFSTALTACSGFQGACPDAQQAEEAGKAFAVCVRSSNEWQCGSAATKIHCGEKSK